MTLLAKAKEIISDPKHWAKHEFAYDKDGYEVHPDSSTAACWCARGAVYAANKSYTGAEVEEAFKHLAAVCPLGVLIGFYNDQPERTHDDIMDLFDKAIEHAQRSSTD